MHVFLLVLSRNLWYSLHEIRKKRLKKKKTVKEEKSKLGESFNQSTTLGAEKIFKDEDEDAYDFLFLLSSNVALLRGEYLNKYIKYLIEVFPKLNYLKNHLLLINFLIFFRIFFLQFFHH